MRFEAAAALGLGHAGWPPGGAELLLSVGGILVWGDFGRGVVALTSGGSRAYSLSVAVFKCGCAGVFLLE